MHQRHLTIIRPGVSNTWLKGCSWVWDP